MKKMKGLLAIIIIGGIIYIPLTLLVCANNNVAGKLKYKIEKMIYKAKRVRKSVM